MHTTLVRPALRKPLQVQTVPHTAGNIHETHRHLFVFSVESLHLTAFANEQHQLAPGSSRAEIHLSLQGIVFVTQPGQPMSHPQGVKPIRARTGGYTKEVECLM